MFNVIRFKEWNMIFVITPIVVKVYSILWRVGIFDNEMWLRKTNDWNYNMYSYFEKLDGIDRSDVKKIYKN